MPLVPANGANAATSAVNAQITKLQNGDLIKSNVDIAKDLAAAYHDYAKSATLPGADMSAGGTVSILEAAFVPDNTPGMATQIAQGICDYWSSFAVAGVPAHGGTSVITVVVNGASVFAAMTSAVQSLITDAQTTDVWLNFYQQTEIVVKTIPCTITEMMPGSPPYPQAWQETIT